MIKAFRVAMATAITAAAVVGIGSANAQVKGTQFATGFQVVNLSSSDANVTISFYAEGSGTAAATFNDTITAAEGQKTYADLSADIPAVPAEFTGSAVISSDQEVAAITNAIADGNFANGSAYSGVSAGGTNVSLPLMFKAGPTNGNYDTFVNVQNTGTEAANVTITYDTGATETATVQAGSAARFDQGTNADLPADYVGSATVTSDQPVAAAVIQNGDPAILAYNGFTSTSTSPVFPLVNANNAGFFTGIPIQNTGDTDTEVTVSYVPDTAGTACTETQTIPAGGATTFALNALSFAPQPTTTCTLGETFVGSASVTTNSANQPLVAVVNQLNIDLVKGGSFNAVDPSEASGTVIMPLIQDRLAGGYFTGFSIVNVGDTATSIECVYSDTNVTQSIENLAPGATWTAQQANVIGEAYNGSGVCTASASGAQIVGVLNQVNLNAPTDAFFVSNAINN